MRVAVKKVIIVLTLLSLGACTSKAQSTPVKPKSTTTQALPPTITFISLDKTVSTVNSKIPTAKSTDFQPLVEQIKQRGGEIRVGNICDNSDKPLASVHIVEPLTIPTAPDPLPRTGQVNPLDLPKLRKEHSGKIATYEKQIVIYKKLAAERDKEADRRSKEFMTQVNALTKKNLTVNPATS